MDRDAAQKAHGGGIQSLSRGPSVADPGASTGGIIVTPKRVTRREAEREGIDVSIVGESKAGKLVRYFQRVHEGTISQKDAAPVCGISTTTFCTRYNEWIKRFQRVSWMVIDT